jgi:hypothetical protein
VIVASIVKQLKKSLVLLKARRNKSGGFLCLFQKRDLREHVAERGELTGK